LAFSGVIITLLIVGFVMEDMAEPFKFEVYDLHKSFGLLALILILIRIPVHIKNPVDSLDGTPKADVIKAKAVQGLLYLSILIMPISGILMSQSSGHEVAFFGLELPMLVAGNEALNGFAHEITSFVMIALLLAHIGASIYHYAKLKDETLKRMTFKG
jgi:cytochrome b561